MLLSTGDYLHLYAAGTPGWVDNGNYTGGWIIMDGTNPDLIIQRSTTHLFVPTMDYEIGDGIYPVNRKRFVLLCIFIETKYDLFNLSRFMSLRL